MDLYESDAISAIRSVDYEVMGEKTVVCLITMSNGHEVVGSHTCVDLDRFDVERGRQRAYERAVDLVQDLLRFRVQDGFAAMWN